MVFVIVDLSENVYGVVSSEYKAQEACLKLKEKDSNTFFDYICCPMNELEYNEEIIYIN